MHRFAILPLGLLVLAPLTAAAQVPYQNPYGYGSGYGPAVNPGAFAPNFYNAQSQPLSPYLNLFRNNPAVNYYYGTRPGTIGGGRSGISGGNMLNNPLFAPQTQFLPQASMALDTAGEPFEPGGKEVVLRPAGHPVIFGNTFNGHGSYYSVYAQAINRGTGAGAGAGARPGAGMPQGASGMGAASPRPGTGMK
jgi:hypothetical protein